MPYPDQLNANRGAPPMRLRTVTGTRFPTKCACGCAQRIPPDPDLKVVVDFETSRPRLTYLPTHSPDYPSRDHGASSGSEAIHALSDKPGRW
jgi:hypothetical protein